VPQIKKKFTLPLHRMH